MSCSFSAMQMVLSSRVSTPIEVEIIKKNYFFYTLCAPNSFIIYDNYSSPNGLHVHLRAVQSSE